MAERAGAARESSWRFRLSQTYTALDGSHDEASVRGGPIDHRHDVKLHWWRTQLEVAYGFAPSWEVELRLPYDVKDQVVRITDQAGEPVHHPESSIHHRTETRAGFGDIELWVRRSWDPAPGHGTFSLAAGITMPTGRTEEDPFRLGDLGLRHRHIQFGTGTVDPLLRADWTWMPGRVGVSLSSRLRFPLYENSKGYRAGASLTAFAGPVVALGDRASVSFGYGLMLQDVDRWHGRRAQNSGLIVHGIYAAIPIRLGERWTLAPSAWRPLSIRVLRGDAFRQGWLVGLSLTLGAGAAPVPDVETAPGPQ